MKLMIGVTETGSMGHIAVEDDPGIFLCGGYKGAGIELLVVETDDEKGTMRSAIETVIHRELCRRCVVLLGKRGGPVRGDTVPWGAVMQETGGTIKL